MQYHTDIADSMPPVWWVAATAAGGPTQGVLSGMITHGTALMHQLLALAGGSL